MRSRRALLVVDEAHAVLGPDLDLPDVDVLRIGTWSKTLGALGGFVAGPARSSSSSRTSPARTSSRPRRRPAAAAALAALRIVRSPEGAALVARLRAHVDRLRPGHPSPIVPFVCGEERARSTRPRCSSTRPPRPRDPAADGPGRHVAAARHGRSAHTDAQVDHLLLALTAVLGAVPPAEERLTLVVVAGTGTDVGKTYVAAAFAAPADAACG